MDSYDNYKDRLSYGMDEAQIRELMGKPDGWRREPIVAAPQR